MAHDRNVAGIRCSQVLAGLSDYLDGVLSALQVQQVEAHLRGCDWCERFGHEFSGVVRNLRIQLGAATPPREEVTRRLWERLDREMAEDEPAT